MVYIGILYTVYISLLNNVPMILKKLKKLYRPIENTKILMDFNIKIYINVDKIKN